MSAPRENLGIAVGVDGSPASKAAVCWAGREAAMRDLPLTLVYVVTPIIPTWPEVPIAFQPEQLGHEQAGVYIADAVKIVEENTPGGVSIDSEVIFGTTVP